MSDSTTYGRTRGSSANVPRAVIHKKILDIAESRPDASMEEIADEASGATVSIVEHVLEEYGDPGNPAVESDGDGDDSERADGGETGGSGDSDDEADLGITSEPEPTAAETVESDLAESDPTEESTMSERESQSNSYLDSPVEPAEVTEKQLETLEEIYEHPDATQAELADRLGVSSATICQRVNTIDGFHWSNRRDFVTNIFDDEADFDTDDGDDFDGGEAGLDDDGPLDRSERMDSNPETDAVRDGTDEGSDRDANTPLEETMPTRSSSNATEPLEELSEQVVEVRQRLMTLEEQFADEPSSTGVLSDLEFTHKIVHACLSADYITEEEELALLKEMTAGGSSST